MFEFTNNKEWEIKKEDTGVTYVSMIFELKWNIGRKKEGTGEIKMKIVVMA